MSVDRLAAFLRARIAEDETRMLAALDNGGPKNTYDTPRRLLAECMAKRRIIQVVEAYRDRKSEDDPIYADVLIA